MSPEGYAPTRARIIERGIALALRELEAPNARATRQAAFGPPARTAAEASWMAPSSKQSLNVSLSAHVMATNRELFSDGPHIGRAIRVLWRGLVLSKRRQP